VAENIDHAFPQQQQCGRCKIFKDLEEYPPSCRGKKGTRCRACSAAYMRGERGPSAAHKPIECVHCGQLFTPKRLDANVKYCSAKCRSAAHAAEVRARRTDTTGESVKLPPVCARCDGVRDGRHRTYCTACVEAIHQERVAINLENELPCARCQVNPRNSTNPSYCQECATIVGREYRDNRRASLGPCARCGDAPRTAKSSYCKSCTTEVNKEYRERSLGSDKLCSRCGVNPRNGSNPSYCAECQSIKAKEAEARRADRVPVINCIKCGEPRDGKHPSYCKECYRLYRKGRLEAPCSKCGEVRKAGDKTNSSYCQDCTRSWWLERKYGITLAEFNDMLAAQDNRCAICQCENNGRTWHVDHDHAMPNGRDSVRGILCDNCNRSLGQIKDNPVIAQSVAEYLRSFMEQPPANNRPNERKRRDGPLSVPPLSHTLNSQKGR